MWGICCRPDLLAKAIIALEVVCSTVKFNHASETTFIYNFDTHVAAHSSNKCLHLIVALHCCHLHIAQEAHLCCVTSDVIRILIREPRLAPATTIRQDCVEQSIFELRQTLGHSGATEPWYDSHQAANGFDLAVILVNDSKNEILHLVVILHSCNLCIA